VSSVNPLDKKFGSSMKPKVESKESGKLVRVQLLVQKSNKRVLYMEAGIDFVDVLFSFLMLPTGEFINLMSQGMNLQSTCLQPR
jgi:hypothetical protein